MWKKRQGCQEKANRKHKKNHHYGVYATSSKARRLRSQGQTSWRKQRYPRDRNRETFRQYDFDDSNRLLSFHRSARHHLLPRAQHLRSLTFRDRCHRLSSLPSSRFPPVPPASPPPVTEQRDDRSPLALAYQWSARITSISLELLLPMLIGLWLDQRWGTLPLLLIVGVILGFVTATLSLLRLAKPK
jgi:hypothetical protein